MTYAENKRRVLAASIATILVLAVGVLLGSALSGSSGVPRAKLTTAQAEATTLRQALAKSEQTLTSSQAAAQAAHTQVTSLSRRAHRLQSETATLTARIRAARHCLVVDRRDPNRCVAKALP